ncbi:NAD(P)H-dependent oxidoreductase [Nitratireductor pacificus]|uniref:Putative NAD(P)H dehydrogenase (Quinone) n=1 Tax=Nitratireductor pacificus pht-3B TaxID=391937 RepID=K2N1U4_9HYPH|nr:NAD(P)H-dependent oxidoreductase [Nitratireductor pacificus]EKF18148.1 putative NAD(P)H dehydrogenase (quinone) [Nitratireductor pacificus pht-3B]
MHVRIVQAHPDPASFNAAMSRAAADALGGLGHTVSVQDLYASRFDPVEKAEHYGNRLDARSFAPLAEQRHAWQTGAVPAQIGAEIAELERADLLILQFPLWWHGPPAILKGWFDRVFVNSGLYTSRMRYDTGYFRERRAMVSVTTGAPESAFGAGARGGNFETMLWPIHYSLHYLGFEVLPPFQVCGVQGHGYAYEDQGMQEQRLRAALGDWAGHVTRAPELPTLPFPGWDDWDADGQPIRRAEPIP